jgi:hypothetical protein
MEQVFTDYFRIPSGILKPTRGGGGQGPKGYFRLGSEIICFGRCSGGASASNPEDKLHDALAGIHADGNDLFVPFDAMELVTDLLRERYVPRATGTGLHSASSIIRRGYYCLRPLLSVALRKHLQRLRLKGWDKRTFPAWPVDRTVDKILTTLLSRTLRASGLDSIPFIWFWPEGKAACSIMTHDVETLAGYRFCPELMDINDRFEIKSSFQIVPTGRYPHSPEVLTEMRSRGFEINVHDWNHDGHLFSDRTLFLDRVPMINGAGTRLGAKGFRAAILYRNTEWFRDFSFEYDMSLPNVAHLDPQPGGCCTVMPYFIGDILEIPVTMTQDYSLFHILRSRSLDLWKHQLEMILEGNGLASFIVHPDYIQTSPEQSVYIELLQYLTELRSQRGLWIPLPGELNRWWRERSQMQLVREDGRWQIRGAGAERARVAYATPDDDGLSYSLSE